MKAKSTKEKFKSALAISSQLFSAVTSHNNLAAFITATLVGAVLLVRPALATERIEQVARHQIVDHIYEYDYVVSTGHDQHHRVGVHRVVQEEHGRPRHSDQAIFMVHGDIWDFNAAFMRGNSSPDSLPVFLAHRGVDVWGIDLGWTLVPDGNRFDVHAALGLTERHR